MLSVPAGAVPVKMFELFGEDVCSKIFEEMSNQAASFWGSTNFISSRNQGVQEA